MPWPKGVPRPNWSKISRFSNCKTCKACGVEKALNDFPFAIWRSNWRKKVAADPTKYRDSCKDCTRAKNGVELDPDFPADRGNMPGRPRKDLKARLKTPAQKLKYQRDQKAALRRKTRISCLRYLAKKGCETCGERDPRVLEFDHRAPKNKTESIATLLSQGYSWANERLRKEIRKCRVLCANCHRIHTAEQQGYYGHELVRAELDRIYTEYGIDPSAPRWTVQRE